MCFCADLMIEIDSSDVLFYGKQIFVMKTADN